MDTREAFNVLEQIVHHPMLKFLTVKEAVLAERSLETIGQLVVKQMQDSETKEEKEVL